MKQTLCHQIPFFFTHGTTAQLSKCAIYCNNRSITILIEAENSPNEPDSIHSSLWILNDPFIYVLILQVFSDFYHKFVIKLNIFMSHELLSQINKPIL